MFPNLSPMLAEVSSAAWAVIATLVGGGSILANVIQWLDKRSERKTQTEQGEVGRLWTWCKEQEKEISDIRVEMAEMRKRLDSLTQENNSLKLEKAILQGQVASLTTEKEKYLQVARSWKKRADELEAELKVARGLDPAGTGGADPDTEVPSVTVTTEVTPATTNEPPKPAKLPRKR